MTKTIQDAEKDTCTCPKCPDCKVCSICKPQTNITDAVTELNQAIGEITALFMSNPQKGIEQIMPTEELTRISDKLTKILHSIDQTAREEERAFILNILDGVDAADRQMGNTHGGTRAIRFALQSRPLTNKP